MTLTNVTIMTEATSLVFLYYRPAHCCHHVWCRKWVNVISDPGLAANTLFAPEAERAASTKVKLLLVSGATSHKCHFKSFRLVKTKQTCGWIDFRRYPSICRGACWPVFGVMGMEAAGWLLVQERAMEGQWYPHGGQMSSVEDCCWEREIVSKSELWQVSHSQKCAKVKIR